MTLRKFTRYIVGLGVLGAIGFFVATTPIAMTPAALPQRTADIANGEKLYHAGGCHSCHLPKSDSGIDSILPAGGTPLPTPIGKLYPPNITPDPETGIGNWKEHEFVIAMQSGKGRDGYPLIPGFPYTSYAKMSENDVRDIFAYLQTLKPVKNQVPPHDVLALNIVRRGLTLWQLIGLDKTEFTADAMQTPSWNRGAYLVNGPGHCNECHTPRTVFMTSDTGKFLSGGPHPEGIGSVPSLRGLIERGRYKDAKDIASALQFGEIMGYDKVSSGGMGKVQANMSKLPESDLLAIGEYLASLK
jgi:mono/diheme cytochrome c family protein